MEQDYRVSVPEGCAGDWRVSRFVIEKETPGVLHYAFHGRPIAPGTYTRLTRGEDVWMSDTPAEVRNHLEPIYYAKYAPEGARILINGLGLGVVLQAVLRNPNVAHIDVVEKAREVIDLVGPHYCTDPRVEIHHADAYEISWPKGYGWYMAWHDIWKDVSTDNLEGMGKLHRKYGKRVSWQSSWQRHELRALRSRKQRSGWW